MGRAKALVEEHRRAVARTAAVPARFRGLVYDIRDRLQALESRIDALGGAASAASDADERELELAVAEVVGAHLDQMFTGVYDHLVEAASSFTSEELQRCRDFFREQLSPLLYQAPLFERSNRKPLGYAGDYEMMNLIYRSEALGKSLFAKCLSRYCINHPNCRAVRNRAVYLHGRITGFVAGRAGRRTRILSVASGPAREIQMLLQDERLDLGDVEIHLLDQDASALRAAQQQLRQLSARRAVAPSIQFVHKAMANVIKGGVDGPYDFVYSAGLFDYFSDALARRAATRLHRLLDAGGELVIGNFRSVDQHRAFMELALDWQLIYRSEDELRALYDGIATTVDVEAEPEQINLFVTLRR